MAEFRLVLLKEFGKAFVPKKYIPILRDYVGKAGLNEVPYGLFGLLFYISAIITTIIFIFFVYPFLSQSELPIFIVSIMAFFSWFAVQMFFATLFILLIYFVLDLKIFHRTKQMEATLPDFLQVLSSNLKGGMTFERALWSAIKPRFQILGNEMAKTSKKVMTGYEVGKALEELSQKYDSPMLRRTVDLMKSEMESGGNIADLLDKIVDNLKETKALKDEMSASAIAYIIFISVIVIVISPLLFALSFQLLDVLLSFVGRLSNLTQNVQSLPFSFNASNSIEPSDFRIFSVVVMMIISFFSSMIVSIVEKGDMKSGLKYIPIYIFGALSFYFIFMKILGTIFSGIV